MSENSKFLTLNRWGNPNAPYSVGNCVAFADLAGTAPVDGTGGSPTVTITRSTATPLDGVASFLFTKDAANRQGEGFSGDVVLQPDDATKMFTLSFDYQLTTGTYTGYQTPPLFSDLTVWVYDVTNSVMYQVMGYQLDGAISTTNQYSYQGQWQVPVGCLQARVIWFLGNTGAAAFTSRINNISFGRTQRVQGTIETPWQSFTPSSFGGFGVVTATDFKWRRVGTDMFILGNFTTGTVGATPALVSIPTGYSIDNSNVGFTSSIIYTTGLWTRNATTEANQGRILCDGASLGLGLVFGAATSMSAGGGGPFAGTTAAVSFASSQLIKVNAQIPILGWGTAGTLGQDADTRVVAAKYGCGACYVLAGNPAMQFSALSYDTHGAATYGTGVTFSYFVPVGGYYQYQVVVTSNNGQSVAGNGDLYRIFAYKNGTTFVGSLIGGWQNGSGTLTFAIAGALGQGSGYFNSGDILSFRFQSDGASFAASPSTLNNSVSINRLSGPAQVQASEIITARYSTNAGQSISNNTITIIDFEDVSYDDHGCVTTGASWKFTAPRAGKVNVSARAQLASNAGWAVGENAYLSVFKNGVEFGRGPFDSPVTATIVVDLSVEDEVNVLSGDTIDIRIFQLSGGSIALVTTNVLNYVCLNYVGGI